jgi:hypothetical protein
MTNTIGYVSTQKTQSTEEMNTDLDLNSSVELYFKTDYVPLDRLAGAGQVDRIKVNTLNPAAEEAAALKAREARTSGARTAESTRSSNLDKSLQPSPQADPAPKPVAPKPVAPTPAAKPEPAKTPPVKPDPAAPATAAKSPAAPTKSK